MAKASITSPKLDRIDARQRYEPRSRSSISAFARIAANGTPTRHSIRGTLSPNIAASAPPLRLFNRSEDGITAARPGAKHFQLAGRAGLTNPLGRARGVSSLWKSGLDLDNTRHLHGGSRAGEDIVEGEGSGDDEYPGEEPLLPEHNNAEWLDERTLIEDLMGLDDETQQNKVKRQEALMDALREHFASLSVSIKQDLVAAVVPVIDNLSSTIALLQKADHDYKNGLGTFDDAAHNHLSTIDSINDEFKKLKDLSLARLKHIVAQVEDERTMRSELCHGFKTRYTEICSAAQDRLARLVTQDIERAALDIEARGNAIVNGKDKSKEKMRKQILKAFA